MIRGCLLTVLLLGAVAAGAGGYAYRDRVTRAARELLPGRAPDPVGPATAPAPDALRRATGALGRLRAGRDSIVLGPAESAALIAARLEPLLGGQLDSIRVALGTGRVELRAVAVTRRLPSGLVGPVGPLLREREPVRVVARVTGTGRRTGRLDVEAVDVRGLPVPQDLIASVLARTFGPAAADGLELELPAGATDLTVRPTGITLFGAQPG